MSTARWNSSPYLQGYGEKEGETTKSTGDMKAFQGASFRVIRVFRGSGCFGLDQNSKNLSRSSGLGLP
jgi:hypothetical protein